MNIPLKNVTQSGRHHFFLLEDICFFTCCCGTQTHGHTPVRKAGSYSIRVQECGGREDITCGQAAVSAAVYLPLKQPSGALTTWHTASNGHPCHLPNCLPSQLPENSHCKGTTSLGVLLSQSQDHLLQAWLAFARRLLRIGVYGLCGAPSLFLPSSSTCPLRPEASGCLCRSPSLSSLSHVAVA